MAELSHRIDCTPLEDYATPTGISVAMTPEEEAQHQQLQADAQAVDARIAATLDGHRADLAAVRAFAEGQSDPHWQALARLVGAR